MSPANKVDVVLLSDRDIPTCFEVLSESFGHDAPFVDNYFPNHDTPSGRAKGSERLLLWKQNSSNSIFLKAVTRTGPGDQECIIGLATWTLMREPPPAELDMAENVEDVWPDKDDREFMTRLWRSYVVPRTQAIKDSNGKGVYGKVEVHKSRTTRYGLLMSWVVLELLAVHPNYQRLGAGAALVKWGIESADEQGLKACSYTIYLPPLWHTFGTYILYAVGV
ncbi:hypothetical protein TruAng_003825 [Truncatella angustata]|nr:hypothetical protein TruAng_003825 [Truncatella angustata]